MLLSPHKKLLFIGDSVTDAGRRETAIPYGSGYVSIVRNTLLARYPALNLTIVNKGVNGDNIRDLAARWEQDVIAERPDYLCVAVGINDVARQFTTDVANAVYPEEYQNTYRTLLRRALDGATPALFLMTPYLIESDRTKPLRRQMDAYGLIVKALATEFKATLIDLQAAWDSGLRYTTPSFWSGDQIHPNGVGSTLIAQAFLRAIQISL